MMTDQSTQWADNSAFFTDRIAANAHDAIDVAAIRLGGVEERARAVATATRSRLEDTQAHAKQTVGAGWSGLKSLVNGKPILAVGCAFAAGIIAEAFMRRR